MTNEELRTMLGLHKKWLNNEDGGVRANMHCADMSHANMHCADMSHADMSYAGMHCAGMSRANMSHADMSGANMSRADMSYADMSYANMSYAGMHCANMRNANMHCADMDGADMRGADIDYSAWPLWCGSLKAHVDDRIAVQLLYHTLSVVQHSPYVSEELKRTLLAPPAVDIANRFHHVEECGELAAYAAEGE